MCTFEDYLKTEKRSSANTVSSYLRDAAQFEAAMAQQGRRMEEVETEDIQEYVHSLIRRGKSAATVTRSVASIRCFYRCLMDIGVCDRDPTKGVSPVKVERKLPQVLTSKEVELFLDQPECTDLKGYRDRAMLELLYATGIRVSEVRYLTVEAARQGKAEISLKGKIRTILLPGKLCRKLLQYAQKQKTASGAIFRTKSGKELGRRQIWAEMKRLCGHAGVDPRKVFPHNLRHLFAMVFYRTSRDIVKLADLLGHSSIETTRIYLVTSGAEHQRTLDRLGLIS